MAMNSRKYIKLAESLPPRLTRFFARYPPQAILSSSSTAVPPSSAIPQDSSTVSADQISSSEDVLSFTNPFKAHKHPVTGRWHDPVFSLRRQADLVKLARKHGVEELLPHTVKGTEERIRRRIENGLRVKGTGVGQRVKGKESERTLKGRYVLTSCLCEDILLQKAKPARGTFANIDPLQIREAQASYVGNATDDPDMERGKLFRSGYASYFADIYSQRGHGRGWKKWPK